VDRPCALDRFQRISYFLFSIRLVGQDIFSAILRTNFLVSVLTKKIIVKKLPAPIASIFDVCNTAVFAFNIQQISYNQN
jgi:hypothetical protein